MSKDLKVSLAFTANTNEAIAQIKNLQKELNNLATGTNLKNSSIAQITPEIQNAMVAAAELQAKLEGAVNVKTGKLDLGKFSESLKKGEKTLTDYARELNALGPAGRQAFQSLAQSVIQAEAPLFRCSNKLKELGTTLANTARWQISSSILHGFMGSVQSALGYAEDLNESLNNIRIVTGQSTEQMAKFAKEANKAAKELSTTTTEYTNASLIYYQQGLSAAEVKERADVTIKLANVSRQSAETVSDQMTAVWNNFYDGSKSLEYYADVMTSLGAATASSTEEISEGLNKFAAVAETVGLSYEYAAAALATVTATTRQSADVVGTAFKTLFARLQDLELGETLDDGTTLGSYSEALNNVGINIKDVNGDVKDMNDILDELGNKWSGLSKDTQVALAQAVAGTRQYTQLVALMDNWDFFQENLDTATSSTGALNKQAEIYAESWEAARDRVTASAEALYEKILDDDFFIDFLDGLSKAIDGVGKLIDSFGGLKGVLFTVGAFATRIFKDEINQGLRNAAYNIKSLLPSGQRERESQKEEAVQALKKLQTSGDSIVNKAENEALQREANMQEWLLKNAKLLSEEELKQVQLQMDAARAADKRALAAAKTLEATKKEAEEIEFLSNFYAKDEARKKARANTQKKYEEDHKDKIEAEVKEEEEKKFKNIFTRTDSDFKNYSSYITKKLNEAKSQTNQSKTNDKVKTTFKGNLEKAAQEGEEEAIEILKIIKEAGETVTNRFKEQMQKEVDQIDFKDIDKKSEEDSKNIQGVIQHSASMNARIG